jgi:hypothetical protein
VDYPFEIFAKSQHTIPISKDEATFSGEMNVEGNSLFFG